MSVFLLTTLAAEMHVAEEMVLKLRYTEKVEFSLVEVEGLRKVTDLSMEWQAMFPLNVITIFTLNSIMIVIY
jgi:hypothetical protein